MLQLVCASANPDKVAEIQQLLAGVVDLQQRPAEVDDIVEDADTLEGNARLKAAAIAAATGLPAIADDTGLFVDALDDRPGVHTARYAGEECSDADNRAKMLDELRNVEHRGARFVTVAMVVWPDGTELVAEGVCRGQIAVSERGTVGFGYDAIFAPDEAEDRTFAEMSPVAKNQISHRGRAFAALLSALEQH